jgi:uncharacterized linocin/CFP29 family protein
MRKNPFGRDSLLTEEEILFIRNKVVTTFQEQLIARQIFPIEQTPDHKFYRFYDQDEPSEAVISMEGKAQSDDFPDLDAHDLKWPVIHKEFLLQWRDLDISSRGTKLLERTIAAHTREVAEAEDRLLLSGECTGVPPWNAMGIEGLFTATGRSTVASIGNWPANAIADINAGRAALQALGFVAVEPVLIGPPALIKCLDGLIANTGITYRTALLENNLISAAMESANAFAADCGVDSVILVVPGQDNFWAAQGVPLTTRLWEDKTGNVHGTIRETIVPVIGRPTSIYEIEVITCAP